MAAARSHHPTRSKTFADDFVDAESQILRVLDGPRPEQLARDLAVRASTIL